MYNEKLSCHILDFDTCQSSFEHLPLQITSDGQCVNLIVIYRPPKSTNIVNTSLSEGVMPAQLKQAVITPLLKKKNLDHEELKNYRPVSNLSFV